MCSQKKKILNSLTKGETTVAKGRTVQYPRLVKLYGTVNDFSPKTSKELTVDMKRLVFGLHFKVTPPEEGSLVINYIGWRISLTRVVMNMIIVPSTPFLTYQKHAKMDIN